jgi:hypothetical protein
MVRDQGIHPGDVLTGIIHSPRAGHAQCLVRPNLVYLQRPVLQGYSWVNILQRGRSIPGGSNISFGDTDYRILAKDTHPSCVHIRFRMTAG